MNFITRFTTRLIFLSVLIFTGLCAFAQDDEISVESADAAYIGLDLEKSYSILETLIDNGDAGDEDMCRALRKLALMDWKYYRRYEQARDRLLTADSLASEPSVTWSLMARIEREKEDYTAALLAAERAIEHARSGKEKDKAVVEYAKTVYRWSADKPEQQEAVDKELLDKASAMLNDVLDRNFGSPKASRLLIGIALLRNDGPSVLRAWRSYFHVPDMQNAYAYMSEASSQMYESCSELNGEPLNRRQKEKLIQALGASRLYVYAGIYARAGHDTKYKSREVKDIIAYASYLKELESVTNEYYRQVATGADVQDEYTGWLERHRKSLWDNLYACRGEGDYNEDSFLQITEKHFGARGFTGSTGNFEGYVLCLGHIVNQKKARIEQYGYEPEFTYTQIDMMISNGYSSWFWENRHIGGWAEADEIIRIREVYLFGPFSAWNMVTDSVEIQRINSITAVLSGEDESDEDAVAAAVAMKMKSDALNNMYNEMKEQGLKDNELKISFLSWYEQCRNQGSILAHEGRHSLEKKYMAEEYSTWSSATKEYHAKLSQILFSPEPKLELSDMIGDIGDYGHAAANKMIRDILTRWMEDNTHRIEGFSPQRSLFSQIHLLTGEQVKECCRQADPLAG